MMDLGLADRLRYWLNPAGFRVIEVEGWETRGRTYAEYAPQGSVNHHTAGALGSDAPSLGICINGRPDLPGPLCQVFGSRSLDAYVIAAGVANHAGPGGWNGLVGNASVGGLEIENAGTDAEPLTERQADFAARVHCALITTPGSPADPANTSQHFEWSTQGKVDFWHWLGADLRSRVAQLLTNGPGGPTPAPPTHEEDEMAKLIMYGNQMQGFAVMDNGDLVHHFYSGPPGPNAAPFAGEKLATGARVGAEIGTLLNAWGIPGRIDLYVEAQGGGSIHAWYEPGSGWGSESLAQPSLT